jgi:hypothetical protein
MLFLLWERGFRLERVGVSAAVSIFIGRDWKKFSGMCCCSFSSLADYSSRAFASSDRFGKFFNAVERCIFLKKFLERDALDAHTSFFVKTGRRSGWQ